LVGLLMASRASAFQHEATVPPGVPGLLKDFTREVLRFQPSNEEFFSFGLDHFQRLLDHEDSKGGIGHLPKEELRRVLDELFIEADTDQSGALSLSEFRTVLKRADLGLRETEVRQLFAEVDIDQSGEISYEEFIPLAVDMIQSMYARMEAADAAAEMDGAVREQAHEILHGMGREQVMEVMADIFKRADVDGSGALSTAEFQKCLKEADIGLTKKEINILMIECDANQDGTIDYAEFVPVAYDILVEIVKSSLVQPPSDLEQYLLDLFTSVDNEQLGRLQVSQLSQALRTADLGLNRVQVHSVAGEAPVDEDGLVDYEAFVPKAAAIVHRLLDYDAQAQRFEAVQKLHEVSARAPPDFETALMAAFEARDPQGKGYIMAEDVERVLTGNELPIVLGSHEINSVLSTLDDFVNPDDGSVFYPEFCAFAAQILAYLAEEMALYD